jgi:hypothetical protein
MTLGRERIMSKEIKVLFWKDIEWLAAVSKGTLPSIYQVETEYVEIPVQIKRNNLDSIFAMLNGSRNPLLDEKLQKWCRSNQIHTSMSVGDVVMLGKDDMYIATNLGWKKL